MEEQPIRILQRPCTNASESNSGGNVPVTKTLEQKAAEYAAARDRIMGADYKPENSTNDSRTQMRMSKEATTHLTQSIVPTSVITATPLMSIQATPYNLNGTSVPQGVTQRPSAGTNQIQKPANHMGNAIRQVARTQQPSNGRVISSSASSPSLHMFSRSRQQAMPLYPTQPRPTANAGLLPTPGFNYTAPNVQMNTGLSHSQSAAMLLMHQFNLLQQQHNYQPTMNGFHNSFPPAAIHTPNINHMSLASVIPPPNGSVKQAYPPPTFN